ncbi:MAG: DUF1559 domain-containing protein [Planctomycetes bacterium]|nr:DUF1559 domain-containing protein [Planctomycetota bacterium]
MTLVELLVAMAVIGVLTAILLPAVQAAREAARRAECQSNLRQLGLAMLTHNDTCRRLPSGGWGFVWTGDPDRGTDKRQPGGWTYNVLPYIEQQGLRELGKGCSPGDKKALAAKVAQTPLNVFNCPSRRGLGLYPYSGAHSLRNSITVPEAARTDYAANAGDVFLGGPGPATLEEGDRTDYDWGNVADATGVCYRRSEVSLSDIVDGTSHTYLIGEKRCNTQRDDWGDDQHMYVGHGLDVARYTSLDQPPTRDGPEEGTGRFGSAHPGGCFFVFVDGSVAMSSYQIDPEIHRRLGNRRDGGIVRQ